MKKNPAPIVIQLSYKEITAARKLCPKDGCVDIVITNTGIGQSVAVVCDGEIRDITDYDCW